MATKPRAVLPGTVTLSTRRCTQRMFLLRPDGVCNAAVLYCLAVAAERYAVEVHAVTVMSTHLAYVCTDRRGRRPDFERCFYSLVARCMNVVRGRAENFWSTDGPSAVELVDAPTVLDKMVYVLTDPVRQHLVERVHAWPGVSSYRHQLRGGAMRVKRPRVFFDAGGSMPEEATLRLVRPEGFEGLSDDAWRDLLERRVRAVEEEMGAKRRRDGSRVAGRKSVLRRSPYGRPATPEKRRTLRPRVAASSAKRRAAALGRMARFEARYREAREAVRAGNRDVLFPYGTFQLAQLGLVRCEAPPT